MSEENDAQSTSHERWPLLGKSEEDLYEMAMVEVQGDSRRAGLWAKALSESLGDIQKTEALYIRYRVGQLMEEQSQEKRTSLAVDQKQPVFYQCPHCGKRFATTKEQVAERDRMSSNKWEGYCSGCLKTFDVRTVLPRVRRSAMAKAPAAQADDWTPSLRKSLIAVILSGVGLLVPLLAVIGVVLGHQVLAYIKNNPEDRDGEQYAQTALVLGYIGIVIQLGIFMAALAGGW